MTPPVSHALALCGVLLAGALSACTADPSLADHDGGAHGGHRRADGTGFVPELGGEYAFATIGEIVNALLADPDTDWSRVDIAALRQHLVDMSRVTLGTDIAVEPIERGAAFLVTADDPLIAESARRMAGDHAAAMGHGPEGGLELRFATQPLENGVRVEVVGDDEGDALRVRALGFHGILALGDHHRRHHLAIAVGESPH